MNEPTALTLGYDPRDPDPWLALELDQSLPFLPVAKQALLHGNRSWSRRWLFPVARPGIFAFFLLVKLVRVISPARPNLNRFLHRLIHWGLRNFCTPEANTLILRHFHIGTELLAFIKGNAGPVEVETVPLRPRTLKALEDNVFLQHDLNLYNFIIQLNASLRAQGRDLAPVARPDFTMLSDGDFALEKLPRGPLNLIDVQTAVEAYTPLYALCLPRADFVRAANSLQLDETIAVTVGKILGSDYHMNFVKNGHAFHPPGRLPADDARARRGGAVWLASDAQAPAGGGLAAGAVAALRVVYPIDISQLSRHSERSGRHHDEPHQSFPIQPLPGRAPAQGCRVP
jgi:hypothetical protein